MATYTFITMIGLIICTVPVFEAAECNQALGMESGAIADGMISASSSMNDRLGPRYARLHRRDGDGGWTAHDSDDEPSLTIDLGHMAEVVAVATQGRKGSNEYVRSYQLQYKSAGEDWRYVLDGNSEKIFDGNSNDDGVVKNMLPEALEAQYIRFIPVTISSRTSMRVELYGCLTGVKSASFDGSNYFKYDLSSPKETLKLEEELIDFRFLTSEPNGIILSGYGTQQDYIVLALVEGKLQLSLNLGSNSYKDGHTTLTVGSLLDDNHWHYGRYVRRGHRLTLYVDGLKVRGHAKGDFMVLNLDREITVGGASEVAKSLHNVNDNFVGCLQLVRISNTADPSQLGIALDIINVVIVGGRTAFSAVGSVMEGCSSSSMTTVTFPTVESYLKWTVQGSFNNFTIHLRFRTFDDNSLILYNAMANGGFIALGLRDSVFIVSIKTSGNGQASDIPTVLGLNDGLWHKVRVEVANGQLIVTVDGVDRRSSQDTSFVSTTSEFYIGGSTIPDIHEPYLEGFRGCISEIHLQNVAVDITSLETGSLPAGVVMEGLQVDTCALFDWCSPNPCEHGGACSSDWDTFVCDCTGTGYDGDVCHSTDYDHLCEHIGLVGEHVVDVDGSGPLDPFTVTCSIDVTTGYHWTEVSHDTETTMDVPSGHEAPGSFSREIGYEASLDQMQALIESSEACTQFIQYQCTNSRLLNSPSGPAYGWWVSRHDQMMTNWGGAATGTGRCACGVGMTCAPDSSKYCNCDGSNTNNQVDEGDLTDKENLPVKELRFGDTGDAGSRASFQLGKLMCRGDVHEDNIVSFVAKEAHMALPVETTPQGALDITLDFKTTVDPADSSNPSSGAVFFAANADEGLIEGLLINARTVQLRFDYGADLTTISSTVQDPLNDNQWHTIRANFDRKSVWLQVDRNSKETVTFARPELTLELTSALYIGSSTVQSDGFVGCMRRLTVNGVIMDMAREAEVAKDVLAGCIGQCSTKPCLNGGECMELYDSVDCQCEETAFDGDYCSAEVGVEMQQGSRISYDLPVALQQNSETDRISLAFRTTQAGGQLFRVEHGSDGAHIDLALDGSGHVVLKVQLDSGTESTLRQSRNFADDKNHFVHVMRDAKEIQFQVDDYTLQRETLTTTSTMFTPDHIYLGNSGDGGNDFAGCISRVEYNTLLPLKIYFSPNRPTGFSATGAISRSRCGIDEQMPVFLASEDYPPTTSEPTTMVQPSAVPVSASLAAGDKAAIAIVVILLLLALFLLLFLIGRYTSRHKGMYTTNEDKGAKNAQTADDAVALQGSKRSKEYYM
ncbi:neurexin-4-like [Diadema antillarum]|uniref:neurexin-4-like n=1 Tax=Diadema antillarum TaxID=105358 RepID=UPI003A8434D1